MTVGPQQFWLTPVRAGQKVTLWIDTTSVHLSIGGWRIKTVPSRLTEVDLARLRRHDGRPAGPPPAGPSPGTLAASRCVEVDRLVDAIGGVTLLNRLILVGSPLAGQRARLRLDGQLMHVLTQDGVLWRTLPCPIPPRLWHRPAARGPGAVGLPARRQRRRAPVRPGTALNRTLESVPGRSSLALPRSAQRKLARQTGHKLREDQQNRPCAQSAIVSYVHLGHADLRHPRGLHGSQHVQHEPDSNFIARAIPGQQPAYHPGARQPWQPARAVVRRGDLAWLSRPPGAGHPGAA